MECCKCQVQLVLVEEQACGTRRWWCRVCMGYLLEVSQERLNYLECQCQNPFSCTRCNEYTLAAAKREMERLILAVEMGTVT